MERALSTGGHGAWSLSLVARPSDWARYADEVRSGSLGFGWVLVDMMYVQARGARV